MRSPKALTFSRDSDTHLLVVTDTVHVYDSVAVSVKNDTVWRERVRFVNRQVERLQHDTVVQVKVEQRTKIERHVPRYLWYLLAIGAAAIVAWIVLLTVWFYRRRIAI